MRHRNGNGKDDEGISYVVFAIEIANCQSALLVESEYTR